MKQFLFLVMLSCIFLPLASCNAEEDKVKMNCDNPVYVEIAGHVLKLPEGQSPYIKKGDKGRRSDCWPVSSPGNPVPADKFEITISLDIGDEKIGFWVDFIDTNALSTAKKNYYQEMLDDLMLQDKSLKNLPVVDGFYKYGYSSRNLYRYFSIEESTNDSLGIPLFLNGCGIAETALLCRPSFHWTPTIHVHVSADTYKIDRNLPIGIWNDLYPMVLKKINNLEVKKVQGYRK